MGSKEIKRFLLFTQITVLVINGKDATKFMTKHFFRYVWHNAKLCHFGFSSTA